MTWLSRIREIVGKRTKGQLGDIETRRDCFNNSWLTFGDAGPDVTVADDKFIALSGTLADEVWDVVEAAALLDENCIKTKTWASLTHLRAALDALKLRAEKETEGPKS